MIRSVGWSCQKALYEKSRRRKDALVRGDQTSGDEIRHWCGGWTGAWGKREGQ